MTDLASKKCLIISFQPECASFACQFEQWDPSHPEIDSAQWERRQTA
jgi:hypothetical protein